MKYKLQTRWKDIFRFGHELFIKVGEGDTTEFELIVSVLIDACLYWSRNCRVTQFQTLKVFELKRNCVLGL